MSSSGEISAVPSQDLLFATIAVDQPVDATYTYVVPMELRRGDGHVAVGSRVSVPLGRGNRMSTGTVLSLSDSRPTGMPLTKTTDPDIPIEGAPAPEALLFAEADAPWETDAALASNKDGEEEGEPETAGLKRIAEVHREIDRVPIELIDLAKWVSSYYCAPIGLTLATMVPAAVKRRVKTPTRRMVSLLQPPVGPDGEPAMLSPQTRKGLEKIRGSLHAGPRSEQDLMLETGVTRLLLKRLVQKGWLSLDKEKSLPHASLPGAAITDDGGTSRPGIDELTMSPEQQKALDDIGPLVEEGANGKFAVRLIHGVTGSGKTEIYIRAIERMRASALRAGKEEPRAIVLVPEISLTPQTVRRFTARFPRVAVLHSGMKDSERHQHWHAIASGWAQVIVGARSAIFAPVKNLGLIIVDEEHDPSYKQDNVPKYHGRDVAIRRAQLANVPVLLGSATPALESWQNAHTHKSWGLLSLRTRPKAGQMPRVMTVDMRQQSKERRGLHILSTTLEHHLRQTLERKHQAIFLLNRRGYAHYVMCARCDWVMMCDNCDTTMVVHRTRHDDADGNPQERKPLKGKVQCHYCLTSMMLPTNCPSCQARVTHLGQGTQRAEDELLRKFPQIRLARMDSDTMTNAAKYQETLDAFGRGEVDLLIGTQMIAKGLDFPNVQLVGVLNADLAMTIPDFRAAERTFQLICQVAGRAGRSTEAGRPQGTVLVQTFQPEEPGIVFACQHDYEGFVASELPHRKGLGYPPFGRMVRIVLSHKGHTTVVESARELGDAIRKIVDSRSLDIRMLGPLPPPMERVNEHYRMEIILFAPTAGPLQTLLQQLRGHHLLGLSVKTSRQPTVKGPNGEIRRLARVEVTVDVDPIRMN